MLEWRFLETYKHSRLSILERRKEERRVRKKRQTILIYIVSKKKRKESGLTNYLLGEH